MMTFTFTSIERFDRLVEALATEHEPGTDEATRIAAALLLAGVGVAARADRASDRAAPLDDAAFDALVRGIARAQTRPTRHGSRIVLTLFGFGIAPRRVLEDAAPLRR